MKRYMITFDLETFVFLVITLVIVFGLRCFLERPIIDDSAVLSESCFLVLLIHNCVCSLSHGSGCRYQASCELRNVLCSDDAGNTMQL